MALINKGKIKDNSMIRSSGMGKKTCFIGWFFVFLSLLLAIITFLLISNITPFDLSRSKIKLFYTANIISIVFLFTIILWQAFLLLREKRAGAAGASLNSRIIGLFAFVAVLPAGLVALIASVTLDRVLEPWFRGDIKVLIEKTQDIASSLRQDECSGLGALTRLMGKDIEQNKPFLLSKENSFHMQSDREVFRKFFVSRSLDLNFSMAILVDETGEVKEFFRNPNDDFFLPPSPKELVEIAPAYPETECMIPKNGSIYHMVIKLPELNNWTLYVARGVRKHALAFRLAADRGVQSYYKLEKENAETQSTLASMFILVAVTLLLSAIWIALTFAERLMIPVRRLIQATDQVANGNYYVQVPVRVSDGDLGHLGETFNKMTAELRIQHDRLLEANETIDKRRRFTETVLSGVSAMVIGVDHNGIISIVNPPAQSFLSHFSKNNSSSKDILGQSLSLLIPELSGIAMEANKSKQKQTHEIPLMVGGRERILKVQVANEHPLSDDGEIVLTIDDITDLVSAQRTSAWADVARRIAHEIKNPLTPIQLSAERIQRKYGKVIKEDRDIFDQCTATIIRQVDDIKGMVDEFSSFARMPKPSISREDLLDTVRQATFLSRIGNPEIEFIEDYTEETLITLFDRRLISQVVTNILKNSSEAIIGNALESSKKGRIKVSVFKESDQHNVIILIDDNGKGFPKTGRQRLLEPYVTTRESGTGLGLAIVAKIMEEHGGGMELLDNPQGKGARVKLWLPLI